jgi:PilZN3 domain
MAGSRVQEYEQKFASEVLRFNPYAVKKLGLLQSQTLLKIEDYMLICAPYQLSMDKIILLVILTPEEINFFQQFRSRLASLTIAFQKQPAKTPMNLLLRGNLERIGPVKGRTNVCLMEIVYKNCPNDLVEIIGDYMLSFEALKTQYENFKDRQVTMDPAVARTMRFNNYVECLPGGQKMPARLLSLGVNRLVLELPLSAQGLAVGQSLACKLYFQTYQFMVGGKIEESTVSEKQRRRVTCALEFSPELVEIMDDYFFRMSFKKG